MILIIMNIMKYKYKYKYHDEMIIQPSMAARWNKSWVPPSPELISIPSMTRSNEVSGVITLLICPICPILCSPTLIQPELGMGYLDLDVNTLDPKVKHM